MCISCENVTLLTFKRLFIFLFMYTKHFNQLNIMKKLDKVLEEVPTLLIRPSGEMKDFPK